jgi:hypothetical protein
MPRRASPVKNFNPVPPAGFSPLMAWFRALIDIERAVLGRADRDVPRRDRASRRQLVRRRRRQSRGSGESTLR